MFWTCFPTSRSATTGSGRARRSPGSARTTRRLDCVVANDDPSIYGPNPLQREWKWLVYGWNVRVAGPEANASPRRTRQRARYIFALPNSPTELEARLRARYPMQRSSP